MALAGTFRAEKKDGTVYYRASITHSSKHISLGSFDSEIKANAAYEAAFAILSSPKKYQPEDYTEETGGGLDFKKWIVLINFKNNGIYIKTPIYMYSNFFNYYLSRNDVLIFDADDLFYFSRHSIMRRGNHLFVAEYGMQVNIASRYGIRNFARPGVDFRFVNGDDHDFRYANIDVMNPYQGVTIERKQGNVVYVTRIHVNGNYLVGRYDTLEQAAVAYNKAADVLEQIGYPRHFEKNFIDKYSRDEYLKLYEKTEISEKFV